MRTSNVIWIVWARIYRLQIEYCFYTKCKITQAMQKHRCTVFIYAQWLRFARVYVKHSDRGKEKGKPQQWKSVNKRHFFDFIYCSEFFSIKTDHLFIIEDGFVHLSATASAVHGRVSFLRKTFFLRKSSSTSESNRALFSTENLRLQMIKEIWFENLIENSILLITKICE